MIKKKKFFLVIIFVLLLCLGGCKSLNISAQIHKNKIEKRALEYMKKKYDKTFEVERSEFITEWQSALPTSSDNIRIYLSDEISVIYSDKKDKFYDNYQSKKISDAIISQIWNPMLEKVKPAILADNDKLPIFFIQDENLGKLDNYYNNFYTGSDISEFILKEKVGIDFSDNYIYIISNFTDSSWKSKFDIIHNTIKEKFSQQYESGVQYAAITEDLYNDLKLENSYTDNEKQKKYADLSMEGCFGKGSSLLGNVETQKYIKVANGIYINDHVANQYYKNYNVNNLVLNEGDIILKEKMDVSALQQIIDKNSECQNKKHLVNSITPIYEIVISDRIKEHYKNTDFKILTTSVKIVPEEIGISSENYLNQYDIYHYKTNGCQIHYLTYGIDFFGRMTISVNNNKSSEYLWVGTK